MDHVPGDTRERDLQPAAPARIFLTRVGAYVDINKSLFGRALHQGAGEIRDWILGTRFESYREFEVEVFCGRSLLQDRLIVAAFAFLQTKVHARRRFLQDNSKRQFTFP